MPSRLSADPPPGCLSPFRAGDHAPLTLVVAFSDSSTLPPTRACGPDQMPLLRISKDRPFAVSCRRIHSRCGIAATASGPTEPPFVHVPSSRFLTALTASASSTLHIYCTVLPAMGFVPFRQPFGLRPPHVVRPSEVFSPISAVSPPFREDRRALRHHPLRSVHRAPCLLTLPVERTHIAADRFRT